MKAYVIEGRTGEYSDHREWIVKGFLDEEKAKNFVIKATQEAQRLFSNREDKYKQKSNEEIHSMDPYYQSDYTGTVYTYYSVEIEE